MKLVFATCLIALFNLNGGTAQGQTLPPVVQIKAMADGAVQIEGQRYSEAEPLKTKLEEINRRVPKPELQIVTQEPADFKVIGAAILLLAKAGFSKVGFITMPKSVHN